MLDCLYNTCPSERIPVQVVAQLPLLQAVNKITLDAQAALMEILKAYNKTAQDVPAAQIPIVDAAKVARRGANAVVIDILKAYNVAEHDA